MSAVDLTIRETDFSQLRRLLAREGGVEAIAYVLCGQSHIQSDPWEKQSRRRFCVHTIIPVPSEGLISADEYHVTWSTESYTKLLKRAEDEKLVPGIVHTHPRGPAYFSAQDDRNEKEFVQMARNRNGDDEQLISLLLANDDQVNARLWPDPRAPIDVDMIRIIGQRLKIQSFSETYADNDFLARQALAFGPDLNKLLRGMRIGIVGCGGTGSATAMLLARLGVGQLVLFDEDIVDVTNLNRLHGACRADADAMRPKVDVLAREIANLGLGVRVIPLRGWVADPRFRDALKACDVIFGCTDDHAGRFFLNRLAYFYLIPVIDMGLAIKVRRDKNSFEHLIGRSTVLFPGAPCLMCLSAIDYNIAARQDMQRSSPEEYERRKREAYIVGGEDPAPAVVTFTTATACFAVNELLQAITDFRSSGGWVWRRERCFNFPPGQEADRFPKSKPNAKCRVCSLTDNWGRCDVDPFLGRVG